MLVLRTSYFLIFFWETNIFEKLIIYLSGLVKYILPPNGKEDAEIIAPERRTVKENRSSSQVAVSDLAIEYN